MKATRILHDLGQSLWFSVTGLTSNPTIFDHAIKNSGDYDDAIKSKRISAGP